MCECYYSDCQHHCKDEPICSQYSCVASAEDLDLYKQKRTELLKSLYKDPNTLSIQIQASTHTRD